MTVPDADERAPTAWNGTAAGSSPESRYVPNRPVVPGTNCGVEETLDVAGLKQGGQQPDLEFLVKRDSAVLSISHPVLGDPKRGEVGRSILGFFSPDHTTEIISKFEKVFAGSEQESFVCRGNPPLAARAWYHCRVLPNFGESGVESATVFVRDITDWKCSENDVRGEIDTLRSQIAELSSEKHQLTDLLAERELREEELIRFRTVIDHAGEAIFITDPHTGRFVDVNETACRWLGHSREELLQMGVGDLHVEFPLENPDGDADHVAETRDSNRPETYLSGSHRRRDGTSFPVEVALSQRRFGDRDLLLVVARDAKQRRRVAQAVVDSENDRRSLFEISRDAIYCSARDGTVCEVNDSAIELFGYSRGEFLRLEAHKLYCDPDHIRAFQQAVDDGGSVKDLPAVFITKSGQPFEGLLGATLRYDNDGDVLGYQCIISPIGETASRASRYPESDAANAKLAAEQATSELAEAKADAEEAKARADSQARELEDAQAEAAAAKANAERAEKEFQKIKSQAAAANMNAEHAMLDAVGAKMEVRKARTRVAAKAREAQQAKREAEKAKKEAKQARAESEQTKRELEQTKTEAAGAKADAERAQSEAEKAKLDFEEANERARAQAQALEESKRELERAKAEAEAERAAERVEATKTDPVEGTSPLEEVILGAEKAWAEAERIERAGEIVVSASDAAANKPKELPSGSNDTLTYLERSGAADKLSTASSEGVDVTPVLKHHRKRSASPKRRRRITPRGWMLVAAVVAGASVIGWLTMSRIGHHNANSLAVESEVTPTSAETVQNTAKSPVLLVPVSEVLADSSTEPSTESATDSLTRQVATAGPRDSDSRARD